MSLRTDISAAISKRLVNQGHLPTAGQLNSLTNEVEGLVARDIFGIWAAYLDNANFPPAPFVKGV